MNTERLLRVADRIESAPDFNMDRFFHPCGSPSCIGGHVIADAFPDYQENLPGDLTRLSEEVGVAIPSYTAVAAKLLDITEGLAYSLFLPAAHTPYMLSSHEVAGVLRHLAKTGELNWSV